MIHSARGQPRPRARCASYPDPHDRPPARDSALDVRLCRSCIAAPVLNASAAVLAAVGRRAESRQVLLDWPSSHASAPDPLGNESPACRAPAFVLHARAASAKPMARSVDELLACSPFTIEPIAPPQPVSEPPCVHRLATADRRRRCGHGQEQAAKGFCCDHRGLHGSGGGCMRHGPIGNVDAGHRPVACHPRDWRAAPIHWRQHERPGRERGPARPRGRSSSAAADVLGAEPSMRSVHSM